MAGYTLQGAPQAAMADPDGSDDASAAAPVVYWETLHDGKDSGAKVRIRSGTPHACAARFSCQPSHFPVSTSFVSLFFKPDIQLYRRLLNVHHR